uniref:Uncharacterized protein n=1 Tax=Oryza barthii TaxID=65489 RepID=A0A0D3FSC7_9ORYZ
MEVAGSYGDCCTHISAGFTLSLLHEHGCDHVDDFPKLGFSRKTCVRRPFEDWRIMNEKFVAVKGLPKTRYSCHPMYRKMVIKGNSYKVLKPVGCGNTPAELWKTMIDITSNAVKTPPVSGGISRELTGKKLSPAIVIAWLVLFPLRPFKLCIT